MRAGAAESKHGPSNAVSARVLVLLVVLVVVVRFQAVTRGKNKLPHDYYTLDPPLFLQIVNPL